MEDSNGDFIDNDENYEAYKASLEFADVYSIEA